MEKQLLLKNILIELNRLPEPYLQHWYELIRMFRESIPIGEAPPSAKRILTGMPLLRR